MFQIIYIFIPIQLVILVQKEKSSLHLTNVAHDAYFIQKIEKQLIRLMSRMDGRSSNFRIRLFRELMGQHWRQGVKKNKVIKLQMCCPKTFLFNTIAYYYLGQKSLCMTIIDFFNSMELYNPELA